MADFRRHGISPLIGAVLLIVFTVSVAAIITGWLTGYAQTQTGTVANQSEQQIECSYAAISITDATFINASDRVDITVANRGTVDMFNLSAFLFLDGAVQNQTYISGLDAGQSKTGKIIYTRNPKPDSVRVTSRQCPAASDEEQAIIVG